MTVISLTTDGAYMFVFAVVCHVSGQTAKCMEATKAALKFRDYGLDKAAFRGENGVNELVKSDIKYFNINLQNDQEIQDSICSVVGNVSGLSFSFFSKIFYL